MANELSSSSRRGGVRGRFSCLLIVVASACSGEPPPRSREPAAPADPWASLPPVPEWLHVTRDFSGDRKAECAQVAKWIEGEAGCTGPLCGHGKDLADGWLARCASIAGAEAAGKVKELRASLADKADAKASACATQAEAILRDGCGAEDKTCELSAQRWATRCAKAEASPITERLLERAVERRLDEPTRVTLDTRACDELRGPLAAAARCDHKFKCEEAWKGVELYRSRCEEGDAPKPSIATAALELIVQHGAELKTAPVAIRPDSPLVTAADVPLALADGSGAVVSVCGARSLDLAGYLAQRKACAGGQIVLARAFRSAQGGTEVTLGTLEVPSDAVFLRRFPTLLAMGEREERDRAALAAFEAELDRDASTAKSNAPEAALALGRAVLARAADLRLRPAFAAALTKRDAALAPAMRELGKAKLGAMRKGRLDAGELLGLYARAQDRAFADLGPEGAVLPGAASRGLYLDTAALLPNATVAFLDALRPADAVARTKRIPPKAVEAAIERGRQQAAACGAALKRLQEAKQSLVACAFGQETCADARVAELEKAIDESLARTEESFATLTLLRSGPAAEASQELAAAAQSAGCREPWW